MSGYETAIAGLDPCVHCGFCLQACPTFVATGDESDSPRGRIVLMQGLRYGDLEANDENVIEHIDRCLGCRACETACPSGVHYGRALEATRARIETVRPLRADAAAVLTVMGEPIIRRIVLAFARLFRPIAKILAGRSPLGFSMGMLAATRPRKQIPRRSETSAPRDTTTATTSGQAVVFRGCIMDGLFGHVNDATGHVLRHNDYEVVGAPGQGCCGALHAHAGRDEKARALALSNIAAFETNPSAWIAVNSAGCGAALKEYGHWFEGTSHADPAHAFSSRVRDVTELLVDVGPKNGKHNGEAVAYDAPCHLQHGQGVHDQPMTVLQAVPGLRIVPHTGADTCCGSAGIYSLLERRMSRVILDDKIQSLKTAAPDLVATGNPGCIMQIGAGLKAAGVDIPVVHPIEILAWSYDDTDSVTDEVP